MAQSLPARRGAARASVSPRPRDNQSVRGTSTGATSIFVYAFIISLAFPPDLTLQIGSINLPIYRIVLIFSFPFTLRKILHSDHFRVTSIDCLFVLFCAWSCTSILTIHGFSAWQFSGITLIETLAPYFLARVFIINHQTFRSFVKVYFLIAAILLPFTLYETLTGNHILRDIARALVGQGTLIGRPPRLGLHRAYGSFEHPIHYGFFAALCVGLVYAIRRNTQQFVVRYATIFVSTICAMSSGPLLALVVQTALIVWDRATTNLAHRWRILLGICIATYLIVDMLSNRTPFHVIVTYMTFRLASSYNRIHIWTYGTESVANHPVFGIGLGEWERPPWMSSSIDNFWLLIAVRYGLPALAFLAAAVFLILWRLGKASSEGSGDTSRVGWGISLVAIIFAGSTVHYWNSLYCLVMFVFGSGIWMLTGPRTELMDDGPGLHERQRNRRLRRSHHHPESRSGRHRRSARR